MGHGHRWSGGLDWQVCCLSPPLRNAKCPHIAFLAPNGQKYANKVQGSGRKVPLPTPPLFNRTKPPSPFECLACVLPPVALD